MSEPLPKYVGEWQGWRRQCGTRTWLPVKGATGFSKSDVYTKLMESELIGDLKAYEYNIMPVGQTPEADVPTYKDRMMRPKDF